MLDTVRASPTPGSPVQFESEHAIYIVGVDCETVGPPDRRTRPPQQKRPDPPFVLDGLGEVVAQCQERLRSLHPSRRGNPKGTRRCVG